MEGHEVYSALVLQLLTHNYKSQKIVLEFLILHITSVTVFLKVQSCKLYYSKYMVTSA